MPRRGCLEQPESRRQQPERRQRSACRRQRPARERQRRLYSPDIASSGGGGPASSAGDSGRPRRRAGRLYRLGCHRRIFEGRDERAASRAPEPRGGTSRCERRCQWSRRGGFARRRGSRRLRLDDERERCVRRASRARGDLRGDEIAGARLLLRRWRRRDAPRRRARERRLRSSIAAPTATSPRRASTANSVGGHRHRRWLTSRHDASSPQYERQAL